MPAIGMIHCSVLASIGGTSILPVRSIGPRRRALGDRAQRDRWAGSGAGLGEMERVPQAVGECNSRVLGGSIRTRSPDDASPDPVR